MLDQVLGAATGGAFNLVGGLIQAGEQAGSAQRQMDFQERMRRTAYQTARKDMEEAGLNPALMFGSGVAAPTPAGTSYTPPNVLEGVASSASDLVRLLQEVRESDSRIEQNRAAAGLSAANANLSQASAKKLGLEIPKVEIEKFFYEQGARVLPYVRRMLDRLENSAKQPAKRWWENNLFDVPPIPEPEQ